MNSSLKILIIEDNPADFVLLERQLRQQGLVAECRRVASDADLDAALQEAWDVVLSDYILPGVDFRSSLLRIQQQKPGLPVILVSGSVGEETAVELLRLGLTDFILKDNLVRLGSAVERALNEAKLRHARQIAETALHESERAGREGQRQARLAALNLMQDAIAARDQLEAVNAALRESEARLALQARRAEALLELPRSADQLDETAFMQRGQELAEELTGSQIAFIHFVNDDQETIELVTWSRRTLESYCKAGFDKHYPVSEAGIWADALRQRKAVVINDYATAIDKHGLPEGHAHLERLISVPVMEGGLVRMMTGVGNKNTPYTEMDVETVQLISNEIWRIVRQQRAEYELRKLALAVEQSPESIVITDLEANLEYVNETFVRNTGYSRAEATGKNPRILHSGKTPKATYDALWTAMKEGRPWKGEFTNKRKDGSEYVEFAIITPLRQPDGKVSHYVAVKEDITEKKRNAAELDRHRLHLEELVEKRTVELTATQREAERLARVKSEFLANMSHEIRTPLNAVLGFAQIGLRDSQGRQSSDTFSRILDSGQVLLRVVNDILDFSKIEAGKMEIERGIVHPGVILDRCADLVQATAHAKGLEFRIEESADLPATCQGDELRLTQVLMNLLSNAIKFTGQGQITLSASRRVVDGAEQLLFRVTDTGIGMSESEQARLFQPFEQADSSTTRQFGGTGLGLAISKRLLGLMEGHIEVTSQPGQGSEFRVSLPLRGAQGLAAQRTRASEIPLPFKSGKRLRDLAILAADDNEVNRLVLEQLLSREGCRLTLVENGQLALERVQTGGAHAFDVVLMDVQMPVMDGLEATRLIKAQAPDLPVIGLTAHALAEERDKCLAAGMVQHVAKPIVLNELINAIRKHVRKDMAAADAEVADSEAQPELALPFVSVGDGQFINWSLVEAHYQGNTEFLIRLLNAIVLGNGEKPQALRQACDERNFKQLAFLTHSLKGMAGGILPGNLHELVVLADAAARDEKEVVFSLVRQLAISLSAFLAEVALYLSAHASGSVPGGLSEAASVQGVDWAEADALLARLLDLVARSDTVANKLYADEGYVLRKAFGAEVDALGRAIQGFDYEAALASLERMKSTRLPPLSE